MDEIPLVYPPMRKKVQRSQETKGIVDAIGVKKKEKKVEWSASRHPSRRRKISEENKLL